MPGASPASPEAARLCLARETAALAANQALYNGFLGAGLLWGLVAGPDGVPIQLFFLGLVLVAQP